MRGVVEVRGRIVPVVHLGALLESGSCPARSGDLVVVVTVDGRRVCLEIDDAELVVRELHALMAPRPFLVSGGAAISTLSACGEPIDTDTLVVYSSLPRSGGSSTRASGRLVGIAMTSSRRRISSSSTSSTPGASRS